MKQIKPYHPTLGKVISSTDVQAQRDAVHIAVYPAVLIAPAKPGQSVGIYNGQASVAYKPHVGIIDPFLKKNPLIGDRVWVCIFPGTTTTPRHAWEHPEIMEPTPKPVTKEPELYYDDSCRGCFT